MTEFTLDWSLQSLTDTQVITLTDQEIHIEMAGSRGALKDAFHLSEKDDQPMLVADLDHGSVKITIRFDDPVTALAFTLWAAEPEPSYLVGDCNIVTRDKDGKKLCVTHSPRQDQPSGTSQTVDVMVPGPLSSLTFSFDPAPTRSAPQVIGIGNLTWDLPTNEKEDYNEFDILKLIGAEVDYISFDAGAPQDGVVAFTNGQTIAFSEIDRVVPCFTPGTAIATPKGEVPVERLRRGDRILTRDNGIQTISWVGTKRLDFAELKAAPQLRPIKIKAGAMGDNMPERDMLVSPSHRMLIVSNQAELYFNQSEILVAAQHMLPMDGVEVSDQPYITYIHIMCENHEIVLSDGAWSESFQPADFTLKGFDAEQREELFALFPELETGEGIAAYGAARRTLNRSEAKLLFKG